MRNSHSTPFALCLATLLAVLAGEARAQDLEMLDFDQKRRGLPPGGLSDDPGGAHCVPTSLTNTFYFLEDHGFAVLPAGSMDPLRFARVTANIELVGLFLGVTASGPTRSIAGIADYLTFVGVTRGVVDPMLLLEVYYDDEDGNEVTFANMKFWFDFQSTMTFSVTEYDKIGDGEFKRRRHSLTLVGLTRRSAGQFTLRYSDPATDESPSDEAEAWDHFKRQSSFQVESMDLEPESAIYDTLTATLMREPSGKRRAVTSYRVVRPFFILSDLSNALGADALEAAEAGDEPPADGAPPPDVRPPTTLTLTTPGNDRLGGPVTVGFPHQVGRALDLAIDPARPRAVYLEVGSNNVWETDLVTGETRIVTALEAPRRLAFGGRRRTLFVLDGPRIVALAPNGRPIRSVPSPVVLNAIAYDPVHERLVAVSLPRQEILYYGVNLELLGSDALPPVPGPGRLTISIDNRTGQTWLHRNGSPSVVAIFYDPMRGGALRSHEVLLDTPRAPLGLFVDDRGTIYTAERGAIHAYDSTGAPSERPTPFAGLPSGPVFTFPRDFTNYGAERYGPHDSPLEDDKEIGE